MKVYFLITIILLPFILPLQIPTVHLGIRTYFNSDNKDFIFEHNGEGRESFLLLIEYNNDFNINCPTWVVDYKGHVFTTTQFFMVDLFPCKCNFNFTGTGNFVIYSFNTPIFIDLKDIYGNINVKAQEITTLKQYAYLTFKVNRLENDTFAYFNYNKSKAIIESVSYDVENPFKICNEEECIENDIQTYNFTRGHSYEIYVKLQNITDDYGQLHYVCPGFSFPQKVDIPPSSCLLNNKFNYIYLILLLLLI